MSSRLVHSPPDRLPWILYGTAWKEAATQTLTLLAIEQGFRGIDTANQRRHYDEASVGQGIAEAVARGWVTRDDLFLQTKFTFRAGQDHRLPYDASATIGEQVEQSFASSLRHLGTTWLDSYLLHGPSQRAGLGPDDWLAWRAMERLHDQGSARRLGISNVSLEQLRALWDAARVRPACVQNRCYASRGWDRAVRTFCREHGVIYQGFSLLTANAHVLASRDLASIAARYARTPSEIVFRFALDVGILPLTGTTNPTHMQADLRIDNFQLDPDEVARIERLGVAFG